MFDLEERLIRFAVDILKFSEKLPKNKAGLHVADQLVMQRAYIYFCKKHKNSE